MTGQYQLISHRENVLNNVFNFENMFDFTNFFKSTISKLITDIRIINNY